MTHKQENPGGEAGALNCLAGRLDGSDYTASPVDIKHHLRFSRLRQQHGLSGPRFERMVERLHHLGPRPLAEMIVEIAAATDEPGLVVDRVAAYAKLDPMLIRALGADRFPPMPLEVVR
jgi:hypothetical protein